MTLPEGSFDAIVVGAGVAGGFVTAHLAHAGVKTLLVERELFPRDKVCGCCLNTRALNALATSPLPAIRQLANQGQPLLGMRLGASGKTASLRFPAGVSLSRSSLDLGLLQAARLAGAQILQGVQARWSGIEDHRACLRLVDSTKDWLVQARLVVAADGLNSELLSAVSGQPSHIEKQSLIGAGTVLPAENSAAFEPGLIHMASGKGGYLGLVRLEDHRLDLAMACQPEAVRQAGGLGQLAARILADAGWQPPQGIIDSRWKGTPRLTRRSPKLESGPVTAVGDATGYIEPFTGEGMGWALEGARNALPLLVARALGKPSHSPLPRAKSGWRQFACKGTAWALRRPRLMGAAVSILKTCPWLATPVIRMTGRGMQWRAPGENPGSPLEALDGFAG